jgi:hypothetical protein
VTKKMRLNNSARWQPTNREKRLAPRHTGQGVWCFGCDARLVRPGEKCPYCGKRLLPRRLKR